MFLKSVSGQRVGAQMIDKLTGDNITSGVTCYVTVDGGTQALGATGSGVCVHEGNGYHTYVPTAGEANGETVAFTFVATGAVTVTKEIYPFNVSVLSENIWDILESSANVSESMGRLLHDALTAATAAAGQAAAALAQGATNEVDIAAIQADLDAKLDVAVSSVSSTAAPDTRDLDEVQHVWHLQRTGTASWQSTPESTLYLTPGSDGVEAFRAGVNCNIQSILPGGTVLAAMTDPESENDQLELAKLGIGPNGLKQMMLAKVEIDLPAGAVPGTSWIRTNVSNNLGAGPFPVYLKVVIVEAPDAE